MNSVKSLYRNPDDKRIAGVCSGIADYFGIETWLARVLTVTAFFLLAGPFVIIVYIACWFILDVRPDHIQVDTTNVVGMEGNTGKGWYPNAKHKISIKQKVWQKGQAPSKALHEVKAIFDDSERRLRDVESYVTSKAFQLDRELSKL